MLFSFFPPIFFLLLILETPERQDHNYKVFYFIEVLHKTEVIFCLDLDKLIAKLKIFSHLIVCWICSFYLCAVFVIKVTHQSVPVLLHSGPQVYQGRY